MNSAITPTPQAVQPLSCVLYFQAGTSDKEYRLSLEPHNQALTGLGAWNVNALYGRRGGNLKPTTKTPAPVDYATAWAIYDRVRREKLSEGYRESCGTAAPGCESAGGATGVSPGREAWESSPNDSSPGGATLSKVEVELLTPIEIADVGRYILSDRYWFQEKADGDRSPVRRDGDTFTRYNRKGEPKPLPASIARALSKSPISKFLLDAEIEGDQLWVFCALEGDGQDLRNYDFFNRYRLAQTIMAGVEGIPLLPVAKTAAEKEQFVRELIAANAEGVVIVDSAAPFKPGRAGQHFKLKFVKTATVRVVGQHGTKRSVEIELRTAAAPGCAWVPFGSVSIPEKHGELPAPGTLIEVRYLYAHRGDHTGGALNQPVYLRRRDDLDDSAATIDQLKFKRGE